MLTLSTSDGHHEVNINTILSIKYINSILSRLQHLAQVIQTTIIILYVIVFELRIPWSLNFKHKNSLR